MAGERPPGVRTPITPEPHVVVDLARPARGGKAYRIEAPDRVLRMWFLLNAVAEERHLVSLPPQPQARVQRLLRDVSGELERSVSPALAGELHHLLGWGEAGPEAGQLRIALASLLGWTGGLVISMLSELEAAQAKQQVADPERPNRTESGSGGHVHPPVRPGVSRRRPQQRPTGGGSPAKPRSRSPRTVTRYV
jgi:Bacterial proteasome activator